MIHTTENEDSLQKQSQDHESVSRLSAKINEQQQSVFSEGESIENGNRENFSYEAILHSKLDIHNEELLDQDGEVAERKLVSPMEMLSQNDVIAQKINNFGCEGLSNMSTSHADSIGIFLLGCFIMFTFRFFCICFLEISIKIRDWRWSENTELSIFIFIYFNQGNN